MPASCAERSAARNEMKDAAGYWRATSNNDEHYVHRVPCRGVIGALTAKGPLKFQDGVIASLTKALADLDRNSIGEPLPGRGPLFEMVEALAQSTDKFG